jgi:hypothetical protein
LAKTIFSCEVSVGCSLSTGWLKSLPVVRCVSVGGSLSSGWLKSLPVVSDCGWEIVNWLIEVMSSEVSECGWKFSDWLNLAPVVRCVIVGRRLLIG